MTVIPNKRTTLKMEVYSKVKESIIAGHLSDHESLTQKKAQELYGVSGTPFREAVQILESEGWLYSLPNKGVYVSALTFEDVEEIVEIRCILETAIANKVSKVFDDEKNRVLQELIDGMNPDITLQSDLEFTNYDYLFHKTLNEYANNKRLLTMNVEIYDLMKRVGNVTLKSPTRRKAVIEEHSLILQGLINGSPEKAVVNHLEKLKKAIRNSLQNQISQNKN